MDGFMTSRCHFFPQEGYFVSYVSVCTRRDNKPVHLSVFDKTMLLLMQYFV